MHFKKLRNYYFIRLERGEEIVTQLQSFCEQNKIKLGFIQGIGAVNKAIVGFFDLSRKKYFSSTYEGDHEITGLTGNITEMNDSPYLHLHINLAGSNNIVVGGHLNEAYVSVTCEIIITVIEGSIDRFPDQEIGVNLLHL